MYQSDIKPVTLLKAQRAAISDSFFQKKEAKTLAYYILKHYLCIAFKEKHFFGIVECGRQDLVGKYVGWTAQIVESKFQAARGGILFIDEAYSLVEDNRTYGAEAINTIVQEMENYRDEVIVIFAGYPEKMKEFLEQNEGLASRIAFHLNFPDYSPEELTQILDLMLEKSEYRMDERTREKCFSICADACREENYGNGRFVRNLLDHAIMRQADRLIREHQNGTLGKEEACLLTADDFEMIGLKKKPQSRQIGFCAG